jgi:hypothetical protein
MEWPWRPGTARNKRRSGALTLARATAVRASNPEHTVLPNLSPNERGVSRPCGFPLRPHCRSELRTRGEGIGPRSGGRGNGALHVINRGDRARAGSGTALVTRATAWRSAARFALEERDRGLPPSWKPALSASLLLFHSVQ